MQACVRCGRGVCATHARATGGGITCVDCLRQVLSDRQQRGGFAHLRDDPHFFWYFDGADWFEAYDDYDYALFDRETAGAEGGDDAALLGEEPWEGS